MSRTPPVRRVRWAQSYRLVNARFPPIHVFERIAAPEDWNALLHLETLTNPRVRDEVGDIALVPPEERVSGPGASWVMAPFTHIGWPSRFSNGSWGVYYAARQLLTAVYEKAHHVAHFYAATQEPLGTSMELRSLVAKIDARFHDVRGGFKTVHARDDYSASQALARQLRRADSNGLVYDSARHEKGQCLAAFKPNAIALPVQGAHLRFHWNGERVDRYFHFGDKKWHTLDRT